MLNLQHIFDKFCENMEGKLSMDMPSSEWTRIVKEFFIEYCQKSGHYFTMYENYMLVDWIWRSDPKVYSTSSIELAVEHEHKSNIDKLLDEEVQHLIDIKAVNKVGIFYPHAGDENEFLKKIKSKIENQSSGVKLSWEENFLIVLGYPTKKRGEKALLFKAFFFDKNGGRIDSREKVILQTQPEI